MLHLARSHWATDRSLSRRLIVAFLYVAASIILKVSLDEHLGARVPYVTFFPAVLFAALYGGLAGGLAATAFSGFAVTFWLEPVGSIAIANASDLVGMAVFLVSGVAVALTCEGMHRTHSRYLAIERQARLAETHQREMLRRYELLAQHSRDIILFVRLRDGRIIEANEAALRAYGVEREEFLTWTVHDLHTPDRRSLTESRLSRGDSTGLLFETEHCRKDGSSFPVEVSARGMTLDGERVLVEVIRDITERKETEEARIASERRYRFLAESNPQVVWTADPEGMLNYINGRLTEFTGLEAKDVLGRRWQNVIHPEDLPATSSAWEHSIATGAPFEGEFRIRCSNGMHLWFLTRALPLRDDLGNIEQWYGTSTDIQERKAAEESVRQSRDDLNRAQAVARTGSWRLDIERNELTWSDETYRIFGVPMGTPMTYELFLSRIHPDDRDNVDRHWAQALHGEPYDIEHRILADGEVRWVRERAELDFGSDGALLGGFGTVQDVTERKQTMEELRKSEAALAQAGVLAHLGAWELDLATRDESGAHPLVWSDEVYRIFGYEPGSVTLSVPLFYRHVHPEDRERVVQRLEHALDQREPYSVEHRIVRPDGSERTVAEYAQVSCDETGRALRVTGAVQDVTDQKNLEELLREQAEALRLADVAKNQFLAMLAHELRNPIGAIANAAMLIGMNTDPHGESRKHVDVLKRQLKHISRLVDDLLDISRITRGKLELRKERIDLMEVLQRAVETAGPQMRLHGHNLTVEQPDSPVWMDADPARLEQIVGNLLNNAAKYTDPGGDIRLALRVCSGQAVIRVEDNGFGISPEMLPRIFDLFAQEDRSLDHSSGGLGIGLTLVKSLVEMHGGTVAAHSEGPGEGSLFTVRLPALEGSQEASGQHEQLRAARAQTILVVDDNLDAVHTLAELLRGSGHQVWVAHDGPTAIEAARKLTPGLVLLDIGLPGMDGYEVARALRLQEGLERTRLVALTGYGNADDRRRSRDAGFDYHLVKPVDLAVLLDVLAEEPLPA